MNCASAKLGVIQTMPTYVFKSSSLIQIANDLYSDRSVLCLKARWVLVLSLLTFAEIRLSRHMKGWHLKECHQGQEEVVIRWLAEEEGIQGSLILRWLTRNNRTSADPKTDEACRTCNIREDPKVPIQVPQILQLAALQ